jgi:putative flippase GtrA
MALKRNHRKGTESQFFLSIVRAIKYTGIGFVIFLFDFTLFLIFVELFNIHYSLALVLTFLISVSISYALHRKFVFSKTNRATHHGLLYYSLVSVLGMFGVIFCMYILVDVLHANIIVSRIIAAGLVGYLSYLINLYGTFQVAGKH